MSFKIPQPVFTWFFVILSVAVFIFLTLLVVLPALDSVQELGSAAEYELAQRVKDRVDSFFLRNISLLKQASLLDSLSSRHDFLGNLLGESGDFENFVILSPSGEILSRLPSGSGREELPAALFKKIPEALQKGLALSEVHRTADGTPHVFVLVSPEGSEEILAGDLNIISLQDTFISLSLRPSDLIYLVGSDGALLVHTEDSLTRSGPFLGESAVVKKALEEGEVKGEELVSDEFFKGRQVLVSAVGLGLAPWKVIVETPSGDIFVVRDRVVTFAIILVLAGTVLITLLIKNSANLLKATGEIRREKDHVAGVINNLNSGIVEYDSDLKILLMNQKAEEILGLKGELAGRTNLKEAQDPRFKNLLQILSLDSSSKMRFSFDRVGEKVDLEISSFTIDRGRDKTFIKVLQDISRDVFLTRVKSEFISVAAHQLRTPLAAVKWTLRVLLDREAGELEPRQEDYLKKTYAANEHMIKLVNDLLDASRIEEGRFGYEFKESDFLEVLGEVLKSVEGLAAKSLIKVEVRSEKKVPRFTFDPQRIKIVLSNLLENAIRYTKPGGLVSVELHKKGSFLEVSVVDTGVGIPDDQKTRIFTKFFRASNAVRLQTEGSGLGLFISRNIVRRHGGEFSFSSEINKGSRFTFTLPLEIEYIPEEEKMVESFLETI